MPPRVHESEEEVAQRRSMALLGLIIVLSLAIGGVVLVHALEKKSQLEDCLMTGRTNCMPLKVPLREGWGEPDAWPLDTLIHLAPAALGSLSRMTGEERPARAARE